MTGRALRPVVTLLLPLILALLPAAASAQPLPPAELPPAEVESPVDALALVDAAIADRRLADADAILRRIKLDPRSPDLRLRQAELAMAAGRRAEALTGFGLLLDELEVGARAWQGLGLARLNEKDIPGAAEALDTAIRQDPGLYRAQLARGVVADRQRDWKRAETAYAAALQIKPADAAALSNRGWSRLLRGNAAQAETDLAAAVAADPGLATAANNLRMARAMQGRYEEAFLGSTPETLAADLDMVGFAALARGDYDVAEAYFRRALALSPQHDKMAATNLEWLEAARARPPAKGKAPAPGP